MNSYFYSLQQHFRLVGISESLKFTSLTIEKLFSPIKPRLFDQKNFA